MSGGPERHWDPAWRDPQDRVDWEAVERVPFQRVPWQGSSWQDGSPQSQPGWQPKGKPQGKSKGEPKGDPTGEPKGDPKGAPKGDSKGGPKGQQKGQPRWDDQAAWAPWASPEREHKSPVLDFQESQAAQHGFKGGQTEFLWEATTDQSVHDAHGAAAAAALAAAAAEDAKLCQCKGCAANNKSGQCWCRMDGKRTEHCQGGKMSRHELYFNLGDIPGEEDIENILPNGLVEKYRGNDETMEWGQLCKACRTYRLEARARKQQAFAGPSPSASPVPSRYASPSPTPSPRPPLSPSPTPSPRPPLSPPPTVNDAVSIRNELRELKKDIQEVTQKLLEQVDVADKKLKETLGLYISTERDIEKHAKVFRDGLDTHDKNEAAVQQDMKFMTGLDRIGAKFEETTKTMFAQADCAREACEGTMLKHGKELREALEEFDKRIAAITALQADKGFKMEEIEEKGEADNVGKILKDLLEEYKGTQNLMAKHTNDFVDVLGKLNEASSTLEPDKTSQMLAGSCS